MMKIRVAITLAILLSCAAGAFAETQTMSVEQAVAIAIENNPSIRNAQLEVQKGGARVAAARTNRLPSLSFEAFGTEGLNRLSLDFEEGAFGTYPDVGPIPNKNTHIEMARTFSMFALARLTQPITQLHKINLGVRMSEAALAADKENERAARQSIAREVKAAYFAVLHAETMVAATTDAVQTHEEVLREMNVRVSQKAALEADRLDAAARLASIQASALVAQNAYASAKQKLNYLLGRDLDTPFSVVLSEAKDLPTSSAFANRPDLREAALRVDQARLDVRIKAAERIPDVALVLSHTTPMNVENLPRNISSAALTISYEPFTWGRREAELAQKRRAVDQAENALRDKRSAAELEVAVRRRGVDEAAAQVQVRRLESEAARERVRVTKARFLQQAARPDEMFGATASLTNAAAREQEAISAYWTARADYEKAIGEE